LVGGQEQRESGQRKVVAPPMDVSGNVESDRAHHDSAKEVGLGGEAHMTTVPAGWRGAARGSEYQALGSRYPLRSERTVVMKVRSSLKSLKRQAGSVVVRREGRTFVVNKRNPRWKARQG